MKSQSVQKCTFGQKIKFSGAMPHASYCKGATDPLRRPHTSVIRHCALPRVTQVFDPLTSSKNVPLSAAPPMPVQ